VAFQQRTPVEFDRSARGVQTAVLYPACGQGPKLDRIHPDARPQRQLDRVVLQHKGLGAQRPAQRVERLAQALPRARLGAFAPQQACQFLPAVGCVPLQDQIGQQGQGLGRVQPQRAAPFGQGGRSGDANFGGRHDRMALW
jgi:hypothetical protein